MRSMWFQTQANEWSIRPVIVRAQEKEKTTHVLTLVFSKAVGGGEIDVIFYFRFLNYYLCGIFIFRHSIILGSRLRGRVNEDIKNEKEIELLPYTHRYMQKERENLVSYAQKIQCYILKTERFFKINNIKRSKKKNV